MRTADPAEDNSNSLHEVKSQDWQLSEGTDLAAVMVAHTERCLLVLDSKMELHVRQDDGTVQDECLGEEVVSSITGATLFEAPLPRPLSGHQVAMVERRQIVDALEEHHAAMRMFVLSAFERLHCEPFEDLDQKLLQGKLHQTSTSQPAEPERDPHPEAELIRMEHHYSTDSSDVEVKENSPTEKRASIGAVDTSMVTVSTTLPHLPSTGILGFQSLMSKTKRYIDIIAGFLVLTNSFVMMLELEMEGRAVGVQLGLGDGSTWTLEEIEPTFQGMDTAFVYIFLAELLLRMLAERCAFFCDGANWFDTVLVLVGLVDVWIIVPLSSSGGGGGTDPQNIVMMRLFRAVKCLRAIRMVRTFRLFRGLNLLVKACQSLLKAHQIQWKTEYGFGTVMEQHIEPCTLSMRSPLLGIGPQMRDPFWKK
eukprot:symbB.v1.2.022959.t1/scaffold2070.1/size90664/7